MIAAVLKGFNQPLELMGLWPGRLDIGHVVVNIASAGICGAQIGEITGAKGPDPYLPHLLGHEGAGVVVEAKGTKLKPGDHVVLHWRKGEGVDAPAPSYLTPDGKRIGAGPVATWAEQVIVSENRCTKIDDDIPFDIACLLGCAVTTGLGLITNEAKMIMGQSILVFGIGGVGASVVKGASMVSAYPITAVDIDAGKLSLAQQFGASHVWAFKNIERKSLLHPTIGCKGYDVVVDCTGNPQVVEMGMDLLCCGGKLILVGQPSFGQDLVFSSFRRHYNGKTMMDSQGGLTNPTTDIPRYLSLWRAKKLDLDSLITARFPLSEVNTAVAQVMAGKVKGRCVLEMK